MGGCSIFVYSVVFVSSGISDVPVNLGATFDSVPGLEHLSGWLQHLGILCCFCKQWQNVTNTVSQRKIHFCVVQSNHGLVQLFNTFCSEQ